MREVVIRVTHIPRQRCAKVLLTMILPVCFYSATPSADVIMEWDLHFMMTLFPAPGNSAIRTTPLPQAKELLITVADVLEYGLANIYTYETDTKIFYGSSILITGG